jgi:hypothetical protein
MNKHLRRLIGIIGTVVGAINVAVNFVEGNVTLLFISLVCLCICYYFGVVNESE